MQLLGPRVLHQQLVPKRNGVHILQSCRPFKVFHRGCIAQISLNDREESELKFIHSLLCLLGLCARDSVTASTALPKRNGVHILPSCKAFQVYYRGCTAQLNLNDREGCELKLIHSLLCHLGSCERDTLYQELGRLCNLKEGGHHFSSGRAVGAVTRPSFNCTNSSPPNEMVSTLFQVAEPFKFFIEGVPLK